MKYSLVLLESYIDGSDIFLLLETYDTVEQAKSAQKLEKNRTIILPSY